MTVNNKDKVKCWAIILINTSLLAFALVLEIPLRLKMGCIVLLSFCNCVAVLGLLRIAKR